MRFTALEVRFGAPGATVGGLYGSGVQLALSSSSSVDSTTGRWGVPWRRASRSFSCEGSFSSEQASLRRRIASFRDSSVDDVPDALAWRVLLLSKSSSRLLNAFTYRAGASLEKMGPGRIMKQSIVLVGDQSMRVTSPTGSHMRQRAQTSAATETSWLCVNEAPRS